MMKARPSLSVLCIFAIFGGCHLFATFLPSPTAALAAAVFGPWSAFAAAMLAVIWSRRPTAFLPRRVPHSP